jgi:dipeptidyl aminopeptidase/acylaminoacyl peptidase
MATALKRKGVEAEVLTIEGAGHGIYPSITSQARGAILEFFGKHLKP